MVKPSPAPSDAPLFSTDDVKLSAIALAVGGRLRSAVPGASGRLTFSFEGLAPEFQFCVENGEVVLPAREFMRAMESILRLVAQHQRATSWRR